MPSGHRILLPSLVLALAVSAAQAAHAAGSVSVKFVEPNRFADVRDARQDASENLRVLASHIEASASRYLADGDKLSVEVLDVDLAGEVRPSHHLLQDVRVLKGGVDWPRITLRYTLESAGQPKRSGEEAISDMAYLQRGAGRTSGDALSHEKRMLDGWFQARFANLGAR